MYPNNAEDVSFLAISFLIYYFKEYFMRKVTVILLLAMLPAMMFSEVVFMPRMGFDIHKGIKSHLLDNAFQGIINKAINKDKKEGEDPSFLKASDLPNSKTLAPMFTIGFDMQFISHASGFTFFFNNEFSYTPKFMAYERFNYAEGAFGGKNFEKEAGNFNEKQNIMLYSFELLMGGTFRRENAFNIHFGIGLKVGLTPGTIKLAIDAFTKGRDAIPDQVTTMVVPAFGGTFGFTYYFTDVVGLSVSVNEFLGFGGFISARTTEKKDDGTPKKAIGFASMGFTNNFAMKIGLNLRVKGVRGEEM